MGVSLGYFSTKALPQQDLDRLLLLASTANRSREWWCEGIWISESTNADGKAFGFTKLLRMIDDEDVDTYMAYLDICEIVTFLFTVSQNLAIGWRVEIEGAPFGEITNGRLSDELNANLTTFLDVFPGDFTLLKLRPRGEILAEWSEK